MDSNGRADLKPSGKSKTTRMRRPSSPNAGRTSKDIPTSLKLPTPPQPMLFVEVSPAKMSPWLAPVPASKEDAQLFGAKCFDSFAKLNPDGSWLKTYQGYSQVMLDGSSEISSETWPQRGTMRNGECFLRPEWEPRIFDDEYLSLPTPKATEHKGGWVSQGGGLSLGAMARHSLWPTPRARDHYPPDWTREQRGAHQGDDLATAVAKKEKWPTPTTRDWKDGSAESCKNVPVNGLLGRAVHKWPTPAAFDAKRGPQTEERMAKGLGGPNLISVVVAEEGKRGGQLNPMWVEWLMGFPLGWTNLDASETPSSHKSHKK